MAQQRDKEETELKVPEALRCPAAIPAPPKTAGADDKACTTRSPEASDPPADQAICTDESRSSSACLPYLSPRPRRMERVVNRCAGCRRRVGLTGFRCRCGELFCSEHRYSDRHDCSFDYKAAGRETIARENPVVRPAKILKV
ncbi:zinc finger A20 and AN1 domain-containing stress-associated protein 5-like [Diospyros lotus]|uniref:zinc finger A20 and AN1 domain-containing stress-associated protein 5-like n=1 Tax=Diospyros lotus TaxID=55363 RepID=UPI00225BFAB0|nr:zinc finger A20 and AN1 domain-containing stress-associated protein 5-like [Diospyros lotus]